MKFVTFSLECPPDQENVIVVGVGAVYQGPPLIMNKLWGENPLNRESVRRLIDPAWLVVLEQLYDSNKIECIAIMPPKLAIFKAADVSWLVVLLRIQKAWRVLLRHSIRLQVMEISGVRTFCRRHSRICRPVYFLPQKSS